MAKPNLEDHLGRKEQLIEINAKDAPVKDINWEAQEMQTEKVEIRDPGQGKPLILRTFEFQLNPALPKDFKFSKQDIFNSHGQQIKTLLWADGMIPLDNPNKKPKVQISKKQNKYRIFVLCMPYQTVLETPTKI